MAPITRVAFFKWRPDATDEQKKGALERLLEMYKKMEHLTNYAPRGGAYRGREGMNKGFDVCFTTQFISSEARDEFNTSPDHDVVKESMTPLVMDAMAFDFEEGQWDF